MWHLKRAGIYTPVEVRELICLINTLSPLPRTLPHTCLAHSTYLLNELKNPKNQGKISGFRSLGIGTCPFGQSVPPSCAPLYLLIWRFMVVFGLSHILQRHICEIVSVIFMWLSFPEYFIHPIAGILSIHILILKSEHSPNDVENSPGM